MAVFPREDREAGFTLIELLVYISLLGVVLGVVGGILIAGLNGQKTVRTLNDASNVSQVVTKSLTAGIRNASGLKVGTASAAGQLLQARVASLTAAGATTWRCQAWYFSKSTSSLYMASSPSGAVAAPTSSFANWTLIARGVTVPAGVAAPFTGASASVSVDLSVASASGKTVRTALTISKRAQSDLTTGPATCF